MADENINNLISIYKDLKKTQQSEENSVNRNVVLYNLLERIVTYGKISGQDISGYRTEKDKIYKELLSAGIEIN